MDDLSLAQARRIALAAQGFLDTPHERPTLRTVQRTLDRTGVLQVDSVNVLQRAHYMPLYARMGPYDTDLVRRASEERPRRMVEYWAHVQAFMPVDLWPVMSHRMAHYRDRRAKWSRAVPRPVMASVLDVVRERGAVTAKEIDAGAPRRTDHWGWNWSQARLALDALYMAGEVAIAGRTSQFEPRYDLTERVIPAAILARPTPTRLEADTELIRRAARSHGVATARDLADYYRMSAVDTRAGLAVLLETGEVRQVAVEGWRAPGYLWSQARVPRRIGARTLLSPFDPVVWERARTESLFDFFYRIEIYTPAHKRVHGYYVLPFLLGDRLVGRVDLKADRRSSTLVVKGAFAEPDAPEETAEELSTELERLSGWLGLEKILADPDSGRGELLSRLRWRG